VRRKRVNFDHYGYLFIAPFFIATLVFVLYPMVDSLFISFSDWTGFGARNMVGFKNYARILSGKVFYRTIATTLKLWAIGSIPQILLALVLAAVMNARKFRGKGFFKVAYFLPNIITSVFMGLLFLFIFGWQGGAVNVALMRFGLISEPIGWQQSALYMTLICGGVLFLQWFGYQTIMLDSGMTGIARDLYEAAEVDGASGVRMFFSITLPLIRPILLYITVTSLIGGLQSFDIPYVLSGKTGDPNQSLLTMSIYMMITAFNQGRYGYGAALGFLYCLVTLLFSVATMRLMRQEA
jgi:multiple sugar transport system permease protein